MTQILEFEDGVFVEIDSAEPIDDRRERRIARGGSVAESVRKNFTDAMNQVKPAVVALKNALDQAAPQQVKVEFSLLIKSQVGAVIAKGSSEAQFKVELTWKNDGTTPSNVSS